MASNFSFPIYALIVVSGPPALVFALFVQVAQDVIGGDGHQVQPVGVAAGEGVELGGGESCGFEGVGEEAERGVAGLLGHDAHALLQAREEVENFMQDFSEDLLWERPAGVASVGYHLQHLVGILDRLFTYAKGEALTEQQLAYL